MDSMRLLIKSSGIQNLNNFCVFSDDLVGIDSIGLGLVMLVPVFFLNYVRHWLAHNNNLFNRSGRLLLQICNYCWHTGARAKSSSLELIKAIYLFSS